MNCVFNKLKSGLKKKSIDMLQFHKSSAESTSHYQCIFINVFFSSLFSLILLFRTKSHYNNQQCIHNRCKYRPDYHPAIFYQARPWLAPQAQRGRSNQTRRSLQMHHARHYLSLIWDNSYPSMNSKRSLPGNYQYSMFLSFHHHLQI